MRRFECLEGSSRKFWEIDLQDTDFTVRFGRLGTEGQQQHKSFASSAKARSEHDKLIAEKQKKGYVECAPASLPPPAPPAAVPPPAPDDPVLPDAPAHRLPRVLVHPPGSSARPPPAAPGETAVTSPPVLAESLVWLDEEFVDWSRREAWDSEVYAHLTPQQWLTVETKLAQVSDPEERAELFEGDFFAYAPPALAVKYLHELVPDEWSAGWMHRIVTRLGLEALPAVERSVDKRRGAAHELFVPFAVARLAPRMAAALGTRGGAEAARDWLSRHPEHATAGLLQAALGAPGKARESARTALRWLSSEGEGPTVLAVAAAASPPVREEMARVLMADPSEQLPVKRPRLPTALADLPAPLLADRSARLPRAAVEALVSLLSVSSLEAPHTGLAQVRTACAPESLARFAWALFEAWLARGAPKEEGWCLQALGLLGDDDTARRLTPLLRQWPGESAHARAVTGLDVLVAIGTDVALVYLHGLAQKAPFQGLKQRAREKLDQLAVSRGLTPEELADRLVPDLGLDAQGSLTLDFGARVFTVGFDESLRPFVRDAEGAMLGELPKPAKKDDAALAEAAGVRWKALKQDARLAAGLQVSRLERAMCERRRWSAAVFRACFVEHPLLIHATRRLVWGVYSSAGDLMHTFRVAEDRTFSDASDDTWRLPPDALVGLPHALELDAKSTQQWAGLLADYQLLQPFAQLGRSTHALTARERASTALARVQGLEVPSTAVAGLEKRGWRRGPSMESGVVHWMEKPVGRGQVATLEIEPGLFTGRIQEAPVQRLGTLEVHGQTGPKRSDACLLGTLEPILASELVRDLEALRPV